MRHRSPRPVVDRLLGRSSPAARHRRLAALAGLLVAGSGATVVSLSGAGGLGGHGDGASADRVASGDPAAPTAFVTDPSSAAARLSRSLDRSPMALPTGATPSTAPPGGSTAPVPSPSTAPATPTGRAAGPATPRSTTTGSTTTGHITSPSTTPPATSSPVAPPSTTSTAGTLTPTATSSPDRTPPHTTVSTVSTTGTDWTVAVSANEPASYQCSLDGAAYQPCAATTTFRDVGHGYHTVRARATDQAGNTDPTPAEVTAKLTGNG